MALHSKTSLGKRKQTLVEGPFIKKLASVLKVNETGFDADVRTNIEAETQNGQCLHGY